MKKKRDNSKLIFRLSIVVICVALLSSFLVSEMYAKYTTKATAEDYTRIAFFINGDDNIQIKNLPYVFTPENANADYDIYIHNNGETTVECSVKVTYEIYGGSSIPMTFSVVDDGGNPADIILKAGESSTDLNLRVRWDSSSENNFVFSNQVGYIIVTLECVQVG